MDINKKEDIVVTILTLAYNHEPYIRECLDGIVMQQTKFKFELLIHDDASTDGTANIIREYESKYPEIIKPIYQKENQYSKKVPIGVTYLYPRAKGKYIALCEGDDYWTDPLKLQKQVDFLEANPDYVMCTHHFNTYNQEDGSFGEDWNLNFTEDFTFDLDFFIKRDCWITQPLTLLFRRCSLNLCEYSQYPNAKDVTLIYHILKKGKGIFLKDNMSIYRCHYGGIWSGANRVQRIKADMETSIGIYDVDKDKKSALLLKNSILLFGYLGFSFLKDNFRMYKRMVKIVYKELGFIECMKMLWHTNNYFHGYFGH